MRKKEDKTAPKTEIYREAPVKGGLPEDYLSEEIRAIKDALGLTDETLSTILHVHRSTLQRWINEKKIPHPANLDMIMKLGYVVRKLNGSMPALTIPLYLRTYRDSLGGRRPMDLLLRGRIRRVLKDIENLDAEQILDIHLSQKF